MAYTVERRVSLEDPWEIVGDLGRWPIATTTWTDTTALNMLMAGGDGIFYRVHAVLME